MGHPQIERLKRRLNTCQTKRADAESKLEESEGKLADAEAKLEGSQRVIAALQASKASLDDTLQQSINAPDMSKQAREAFEEEITILRQRGEEIQETLESLEEDNQDRKQHEYKAKHSLLRSFRWKERDVDPVVLDGAVAFWGATADKDCTGTSTRTSKETRKKL
jgi:chromosome segregation ATPase